MVAFTDSFAYSDGSYLKNQPGWADKSASLPAGLYQRYVVNSGQLTVVAGAGYATSVIHDTGSTEHYVESQFLHAATGYRPAQILAAADGDNWVGLATFNDQLVLISCVAGTIANIHPGAAGTYVPGAIYRTTKSSTNYTVSRNAVVIGEFASIAFSNAAIDSNRGTGYSARDGNVNGLYDAFASDITGVGAISFTNEPKANQVFIIPKTGPAQRTLTYNGVYAGDVTALEFRLEGYLSGTVVPGLDWQDLPAGSTFSGGNFSLTLTVPAGPWVRLRVRAKNHPTEVVAATQNRWGVGLLGVFDGQSNIENWKSSGFTTADELVAKFDPATGDWVKTSIGVAENIFCAKLAAANGCVVAYANVAVGSTNIEPHVNAGYWTALLAAIDAMGGEISFYVWKQGEGDTGGSGVAGNVTAYVNFFTTLATNLRAHCGRTAAQLPIVICPIGRQMGVTANDNDWTNIREAHYRLANVYPGVTGVPSCFIGGDAIALPHGVGNALHEDLSGNSESAARAVQSLLKAAGKVANDGEGPIPLFAVLFNPYIWVSFNLNGASALSQTAAGNLVGWVVRDGTGTIVAGTVATLVGNQVRIALPGSPPAGPYTVAHLEGQDPLAGAVDATTVALVQGNVQLRPGGLYIEAVATRKRLPVSTGVVLSSTDVASVISIDPVVIVPQIKLATADIAVAVTVDGKPIATKAFLQSADLAAVVSVDASAIKVLLSLSSSDIAASVSMDRSSISVGAADLAVDGQRILFVEREDRPRARWFGLGWRAGGLYGPPPRIPKAPAAILDYSIDWRARGWLRDGEQITAVSWNMPGIVERVRDLLADGVATVVVAGGQIGESARLSCTISTSQGRADTRTFQLDIIDR